MPVNLPPLGDLCAEHSTSPDIVPQIHTDCHLFPTLPNTLEDSKQSEHPCFCLISECTVQQVFTFFNKKENRQGFINPFYSHNYFPRESSMENHS